MSVLRSRGVSSVLPSLSLYPRMLYGQRQWSQICSSVDVRQRVFEPQRLPSHWTSLVIPVRVRFGSGRITTWNCLIDTGAMFSVVRSDLVSACNWFPAKHPRSFQTASGEFLVGGQRGVFVNLSFSGVANCNKH